MFSRGTTLRAAVAAIAALALAGPAAHGQVLPDLGEPPPTGGTQPTQPAPPGPLPVTSPMSSAAAFQGTGQWIWYVSKSERGNIDAIAARAQAAGVRTLFIKSGDAGNAWSQFTPGLVQALHARGLRVCGWQYVYGKKPLAEAIAGAAAAEAGADCFVIDAESEYQGRYASASIYVRELRARVGAGFPVALAGFPYVDYHPSFPYSVFLGAGGAEFNQPQMYWKTIGTSVDRCFQHTYMYNEIYKRPLVPLGQTYLNPSRRDLLRFRSLTSAYGAPGSSYWSWQGTNSTGWSALATPVTAVKRPARPSYPVLKLKKKGDLVVWAQEHLAAAGNMAARSITGVFGRGTETAVRNFQTARGIVPTGMIGDITWAALLRLTPVPIAWDTPKAARKGAQARAASAGSAARAPLSAALPALRYELPRKRG
jgi:hypothetical protein